MTSTTLHLACMLGLFGLCLSSPILSSEEGPSQGAQEMQYVEPQNAAELRGINYEICAAQRAIKIPIILQSLKSNIVELGSYLGWGREPVLLPTYKVG